MQSYSTVHSYGLILSHLGHHLMCSLYGAQTKGPYEMAHMGLHMGCHILVAYQMESTWGKSGRLHVGNTSTCPYGYHMIWENQGQCLWAFTGLANMGSLPCGKTLGHCHVEIHWASICWAAACRGTRWATGGQGGLQGDKEGNCPPP